MNDATDGPLGSRLVIGDADADLSAALTAELEAYNAVAVDAGEQREMSVKVVVADGDVVAGLTGWTWGTCAGISLVWVREDARRQGWGGQLLAAAERVAEQRGCRQIIVTSFTFQAPRFYERHGYVETGRIEGLPLAGAADVQLCKQLQPGAGRNQQPAQGLTLRPIGRVTSERTEPLDDDWDSVPASITLDREQFGPAALQGLDAFSHIEVVYVFDRVDPGSVQTAARHPRGNPDWPAVGIFAQRAKGRPNRLGVSTCRLIAVRDLTITVQGLDAIDATPVLDIKPYLAEFAPRGQVRQPGWSSELMAGYWHGRP